MDKLRRKPRWTLPLAKVKQNSPSARDGIPYEDELVRQSKGVNFIVQVSTQLNLPPITIYSAACYLHRFYTRYSLKRFHYYEAGGACIFLASKAEETPRRIREVAFVCTRVASKNPRLQVDEKSKDFERWVDTITYTEEALLEGLFFDLSIDSPYQALARLTAVYGMANVDNFTTLATNFINDSCRTMLSVLYSSAQIAAGAYYWTVKHLHLQVPPKDNQKWYEVEGLDRGLLVDVVNNMADMLATIRGGNLDGQIYERLK